MIKKRKKYKKYTDENLVFRIIDKQFKMIGLRFEYAKNIQCWYSVFQHTEEQNKEWMKWGEDYIIKHTTNCLLKRKRYAKREMQMLNLNYGLKIDYGLRERIIMVEKVNKNDKNLEEIE